MVAKSSQHRSVVNPTLVQHDTPDARIVPEFFVKRVVLVFAFVASLLVLALRPRTYDR